MMSAALAPQRVYVVTDSTADVPAPLVEELEITVVPNYINFGLESLRDQVEISRQSFYRRLTTEPVLPTTAAPSVGDFEAAYRRLLPRLEGAGPGSGIVSIHCAANLSAIHGPWPPAFPMPRSSSRRPRPSWASTSGRGPWASQRSSGLLAQHRRRLQKMSISIVAEPAPLTVDADGVIRVGGTRVTLDTIVAAFLDGATAEEIAQQYPSLDLADIYAAISYYLRHRPEVEAYLQQRRRLAEEVRRENESRFAPHGVRARLLARRQRRE